MLTGVHADTWQHIQRNLYLHVHQTSNQVMTRHFVTLHTPKYSSNFPSLKEPLTTVTSSIVLLLPFKVERKNSEMRDTHCLRSCNFKSFACLFDLRITWWFFFSKPLFKGYLWYLENISDFRKYLENRNYFGISIRFCSLTHAIVKVSHLDTKLTLFNTSTSHTDTSWQSWLSLTFRSYLEELLLELSSLELQQLLRFFAKFF